MAHGERSVSVAVMLSSRHASRTCRRPGCQGSATATLSFRYDSAEALLLDLVDEPHPSRWDLCKLHADTLSVPRGWDLIDRREGSAPPPPPQPTVSPRHNRYAELKARLPALAAEQGHPPQPIGSSQEEGRHEDRRPATEADVAGRQRPVQDSTTPDVIPGQLTMPFADFSGAADGGNWDYPGNVVPLMRKGPLDPVT